jgi:hypothetical protein
MHDRIDCMLGEDPVEQGTVGDRAFMESDAGGNELANAVRQIVDNDDIATAVRQGKDRVAADIAGPASHEHNSVPHQFTSSIRFWPECACAAIAQGSKRLALN